MNISRSMTEIIGVSGAGKTTLAKMLNERSPRVKAGITIWRLSRVLLVQSIVLTIPMLLRLKLENSSFDFETGKQIVRLRAFNRHLKMLSERSEGFADFNFFDEGAIFAISKIRADRADFAQLLTSWEDKFFEFWGKYLDRIIWLDAPDEILVERIRRREKKHRMKHKPDAEIEEFLARYRRAYEDAVNQLKKHGNLEIIRFDTAKNTLDEIAVRIVSQTARH